MPRRSNGFMDRFIDQFAEAVAAKLADSQSARGAKRANGRRGASPLKGRNLDMRCRYPSCKNRSKGPKYHFLCEKHLKVPLRKAKAAIAKAASTPADRAT